jgi:flagellar biogenesis protein FliO
VADARRARKRATGGLGIESMLALGERRSLAIVTVEGRRLLVGLAPHNVSLVTELGARQSFDDAVAKALDGPQS